MWRHLVNACEVKTTGSDVGNTLAPSVSGSLWLLWLSCMTVVSLVAVLRGSVGTSHMYIVAVLRDRLL